MGHNIKQSTKFALYPLQEDALIRINFLTEQYAHYAIPNVTKVFLHVCWCRFREASNNRYGFALPVECRGLD